MAKRDWLTSWEAADLAEVAHSTMKRWLLVDRHLGLRVVGKWRVNRKRLNELLAGAPIDPREGAA